MQPRTLVLSLVLLCTSLLSCRKEKEHRCVSKYYPVGANLAIAGYDTALLHPLVFSVFHPDSTFSNPIRTDTVTFRSLDTMGTVMVVHASSSMVGLDAALQYTLTIPQVGRTYKISSLIYSDSGEYIYYAAQCAKGTFTQSPDLAIVDGVQVSLRGGLPRYLVLSP